MASIETLIREIRYDFIPNRMELLQGEDELWRIFESALKQQSLSPLAVQETIQESQAFFKVLVTSPNPYQELRNTVLNYVRAKKNIFVFLDEKDIFLTSLAEYISKTLPMEKRTWLLNTLFKLKKVIEDIAWQRESELVYPTRVVTSDFFLPIQYMVDSLLQEVFSWVNPLMVCFFAPDQQGEMTALSVVGQDKTIFDDLTIRTSFSTKWGRGPVAAVFRSGKPTYIFNRRDPRLGPFISFWEEQGINSAILFPITRGHFNFGVLAIPMSVELDEAVDIEEKLLPFVEKFTDFLVLNYKENHEMIYCSLLTANYTKSLETIVSILEKKDAYTAFHSQLVTKYALLIAENLNVPEKECRILHDGSILHDIGKVGIVDKILLKNSSLNEKEWTSMKSHPQLGNQIVSHLNISRDIADIVFYHHERWDGRGYPLGLQNEEIPYLARIVSVADALEAITSHRSYRSAMSFKYAREEIARCSGSQFDPLIVKSFLTIPEDLFTLDSSSLKPSDKN